MENADGTTVQDGLIIRERLLANRRNATALLEKSRTGTTYIKVSPHLVAENDGSGRFPTKAMFRNMCELNEQYQSEGFDVKFILESPYISKINNRALYLHDDRTISALIMSTERVPNSINMFYCLRAGELPTGGVAGGYYTPGGDVIVFTPGNMSPIDQTTATHEIGHYFTLNHTFYGWEEGPWAGTPTPVVVEHGYGGGVYTERVSRVDSLKNCHMAADNFCDTDPNYYFSSTGLVNCNGAINPATFDCKDPLGENVTITDQQTNVMSYFSGNCARSFSQEQKTAIEADIIARGYHNNLAPNLGEVTSTPVITYPTDGATAQFGYDLVELRWDAVQNATHYFIKVERQVVPGVYEENTEIIVNTNSAWLTSLDPAKTYRWSVLPYNIESYCPSNISANYTFETTDWMTGTQELATLNDWTVYPNPISKGEDLNMTLDVQNNSSATLTVFNSLGEQVQHVHNLSLVAGNNTFSVSTMDLATGVYHLFLDTKEGREVRRFIIK